MGGDSLSRAWFFFCGSLKRPSSAILVVCLTGCLVMWCMSSCLCAAFSGLRFQLVDTACSVCQMSGMTLVHVCEYGASSRRLRPTECFARTQAFLATVVPSGHCLRGPCR
jgi:hypothetical protein